MRAVFVVARKEIRDNLRDRRSVAAALIYPLLGPLMFAMALQLLGQSVVSGTQSPVSVPVLGAQHAPALMAYFGQQGVTADTRPVNPELAVKQRRQRVVLVIKPGFEESLGQGGEVRLSLYSDASTFRGEVLAIRIATLIREYSRSVGVQRISKQGLDSRILDPVKIDNVILVKRRSIADLFLQMVPPFIMFTVFIGGVYLAIDAVSGERERGSLEPLLTNPVPRWEIMMGKFAAAYLFTAVSLVVQLASFAVAFSRANMQMFSEGTGYDSRTVGLILLVAPPLMALTVTLQMIIAAITRSFKEALTWLGLLPLAPAATSFTLVFVPVAGSLWLMVVPILSQTVLLGQIMRGETPAASAILVAGVSTLGATALLLRFAASLFEREEIVFGA